MRLALSSFPELAQMLGLPYKVYEQGVRRYGFHALSRAVAPPEWHPTGAEPVCTVGLRGRQ
jgi:acetate kinase